MSRDVGIVPIHFFNKEARESDVQNSPEKISDAGTERYSNSSDSEVETTIN